MCGRFTLTAEAKELAKRFGVEISASFYRNFAPNFNIAPTQSVIVVGDDGKRYVTQMRWGLVPSWATDPSIGNRMINARAETLLAKPAFRVAFRKRRCLILADGFYEWQQRGNIKQPVRIVLKPSPTEPKRSGDATMPVFRDRDVSGAKRELFAFAGLWDTWKPRLTEPKRSGDATVPVSGAIAPTMSRAATARRRGNPNMRHHHNGSQRIAQGRASSDARHTTPRQGRRVA